MKYKRESFEDDRVFSCSHNPKKQIKERFALHIGPKYLQHSKLVNLMGFMTCDSVSNFSFFSFSLNISALLFKAFLASCSCQSRIISIFHGCMVWTEKPVTRVTDWHHEACRVMPNSDPK